MAHANDFQNLLGHIDRDNRIESHFERIAIVNRGGAATRLIQAIRELNRERQLSLSTVALFIEPDRQAMFMREADDAVCNSTR